MKKILSMLCVFTILFSLTACGEVEKELTNVAVYEGCQLELKDAEIFTNDEGIQMVRVNAVYTNQNQDPLYASCSFAVRAFQNDIELTECSNINGSEESLIREIKNGQSLEVSYVFELSEESEVEVLIGTPTADMDTIGKQVYFESEE